MIVWMSVQLTNTDQSFTGFMQDSDWCGLSELVKGHLMYGLQGEILFPLLFLVISGAD